MTRSELIARIAKLNPQLLPKDADLIVKTIIESMTDTLARGGRIEIRGFGSFGLNYRPPRLGRNPKTGVSVKVPAKYVPHFKAGKEMRERVEEIKRPNGSVRIIRNASTRRLSALKTHPNTISGNADELASLSWEHTWKPTL